jgi:hypothetical protein
MARSRRNRFSGWKTGRPTIPPPRQHYVLSRYDRPQRQAINYETAFPLQPPFIMGVLQHALTPSVPPNAVYLGTLSRLLNEAASGACKLNWDALCAPIPFPAPEKLRMPAPPEPPSLPQIPEPKFKELPPPPERQEAIPAFTIMQKLIPALRERAQHRADEQADHRHRSDQEKWQTNVGAVRAANDATWHTYQRKKALAELLMKQSGDSSLDKAREQHRHHGLTANIQIPRGGVTSLDVVASSMSALPVLRDGDGIGTFELWHRTARRHPLAGIMHKPPITSFSVFYVADDKRLPRIDANGVTLLECFKSMPGLTGTLGMYRIMSDIVRAKLATHYRGNENEVRIDFHPGPVEVWQACMEHISIRAIHHERVHNDIQESFGTIIMRHDPSHPVEAQLPEGIMLGPEDVRFWSRELGLNEFGLIYVALFILVNYARYYPDKWIKDVERATPIAHVAEQTLELAAERAPLLTLSELSRCLYVPGSML